MRVIRQQKGCWQCRTIDYVITYFLYQERDDRRLDSISTFVHSLTLYDITNSPLFVWIIQRNILRQTLSCRATRISFLNQTSASISTCSFGSSPVKPRLCRQTALTFLRQGTFS